MEETAQEFDWVRKIEKRAGFFVAWRAEMATLRELAANGFYIRVGSTGYRLISVSTDNPCGRLYRREKRTEIGYSANMLTAVRSAEIAEAYGPNADKPEHRMQAAIIKHALMNDLSLHGAIDGFGDVFDELIFVTDELSAGKIRADIIALGGTQGSYFPVFIELKAVRSLGRLVEQLDAAKETMKMAGDSFLRLLESATGKPKTKISLGDAKSLIIWRDSPSGKERDVVAAARSNGYLIAAYDDASGHARRVPGK